MPFARILRSSALMGGAQVVTMASAFLRSKLIAVLIGPSGIGLMGVLGTFNAQLSTIAGWGLGTSAVRTIAGASELDRDRKISAVRKLGRRLAWTGFMGVLLLVVPVGYMTFKTQEYALEILIAGLAVPCIIATSMWSALLQAGGHVGMGFGSAALDSGIYQGGTSWELSAGNGLKYALGADYRISEKVTLQATVGKELSTVPASNGDLTFNRTPVELLGFVDLSKDFRLGAGLRNSTNSSVSSSGAGNNYPSIGNWSASVGAVVEAQYIFDSKMKADGGVSQFGVNLRLVSENFTKDAVTKSGDHYEVGVFLYY